MTFEQDNALSHVLLDGTTAINHASYQKKVKSMKSAQLRWTIKDAREAMEAMPLGHKSGYYADEILYCASELGKRRRA